MWPFLLLPYHCTRQAKGGQEEADAAVWQWLTRAGRAALGPAGANCFGRDPAEAISIQEGNTDLKTLP